MDDGNELFDDDNDPSEPKEDEKKGIGNIGLLKPGPKTVK